MKIGIVSPVTLTMLAHYVRGGEQMPEGYPFPSMAPYIEELIRRGHQVSLFTLAPSLQKPQIFEGEHLRVHIGRLRPRGRARDLFTFERAELVNAMQSDPVEVLHAQWTYEFALAALQMPSPVLVTARDAPLNILRYSPDAYRLVRLFLAALVCRQTQHLTAVSTYIQRHFQRFFGYAKPITVIPNGIPDSVYNAALDTSHPKGQRIVFAANLTGWSKFKNCGTLLSAFAITKSVLPECGLWLFGAGNGVGEQAQRWAETRGLTQGVVFQGRTPYEQLLRQLSTNVDVLVHPALEESFSMAVAEAMALGIPVIGGSHSGAVPDTLGDGGLLVDVRSAQRIADAMITLANDRALRDSLGAAGRSRALENFSLAQVTGAYEGLYTRLANEQNRLPTPKARK